MHHGNHRLSQLLSPLAALLLLAGGCSVEKNSMVAPSGAIVNLGTTPQLIAANATAPVTIALSNGGGPVPDGTEVWLTATRGELDQAKSRTRDGKVTVNFKAPPDSGPVQISAASGDARGTFELAVTSAPVASVAISADPGQIPPAGGQVGLVATVLGPNGQGVSGAPVSFKTSAGSVNPTTPVLSDGDGKARATLTANAAAVVSVNIQEQFPVQLAIPLAASINFSASTRTPSTGQAVTFTIEIKGSGSGKASLVAGDGTTVDLGPVTLPTTLKPVHTYLSAGGFNASAVYQPEVGGSIRETIRIEVSGPVAPPPSAPGPSLPESGVPFSLSDVTWLHTNVSNWRITSRITSISIGDPPICINHTKSGRWPVRDGVEGNPWVFANLNGRWYAGTYEWLRPGQVCKQITASNIGPHVKQEPLTGWRPRSGDQIGLMVSALARFGQQSVAERSNIVMVRWP